MKKIIILTAIIMLSASSAMASIFLDVSFMNAGGGDLEMQNGGALSLGFSVHKDYIIKFRTAYTRHSSLSTSSNDNISVTSGVEYLYIFPTFPMVIRPSVMLGVCGTHIDGGGTSDTGYGIAASIGVGFDYLATRHIAPFVEAGYHRSFYLSNNFKDANFSGYTANIGVRFAFSGYRSIYSDY